jgi:aminomethyltransferase
VTGLEKYVELDQEQDFVGKAALARIAREGVDRKLVGVQIGGEPMTDEGALNDFWPVVAGGGPVGRVTAGAWSPRLERNVGYAWVPIGLAEVGTGLQIEDPRGTRPATVHELPFVDPNKDVPKS